MRLLTRPAIQPKLSVSHPEDESEREADRVADQVMRMPEPHSVPAVQRSPLKIHRMCTKCEDELQRKTDLGHAPVPEDEEGFVQAQFGSSQSSVESSISRKCESCETALRQRQEEEETSVAAKQENGGSPASLKRVEVYLANRSGSGRPLDLSTRSFFGPRFNADFGDVRVHTDSPAARAAGNINALAFTRGQDIFFKQGAYDPGSFNGQRLLAHELTHVVQQGAATRTPTIQREEDEAFEEPALGPTDDDINAVEEGQPVERRGVVQMEEGTNLWPQTNDKAPKLGLLPFNTRVFVDSNLDGGWYSVYVEKHQRGEALPVAVGTHGYVRAGRVSIDMPDPDSWLFRIKSGQGALAVAAEAYKDNFKAAWGKDYRYLVNVLVAVNNAKQRAFLYKEHPADSWDDAKTMRNGQIWVPGLKLVDALHGQISSGSISYEVLSLIQEAAIGLGGFIVGVLEGAVMSIADIFIGLYDLIKMAIEIIIKLVKGTLLADAMEFFSDISKIKASDISKMVGDKWDNPDTWERWKFRGYVIGYAIVEILLLIFSVGIVTAVKWAGKVSKIGKLAKYLSELKVVQKLTKAAEAMKGKGVDAIRAALKAANTISEAHGWAAKVLRLPMHILQRLSEADIGKLKKLPQWVRERFARLADAAKLRILGCYSPCKVDVREIEAALKLATKGGKKLSGADAVLGVLKKLDSRLKTEKISRKLRQNDSALMKAIQEAGLTDTDFAKLADFLTPGDVENPAQAYRTFVRYLTGVVPAKTGNDMKRFNEIMASMVQVEPRRGAALKGAMFEQWVTLHVPSLASRSFKRITFDLWKLLKKKLPPYSRPVDKWVPDKGEIWEIKHQLSKVPSDQVVDYSNLVGKVAPDGNLVKAVNYVFPTKEAATLNKHLADTYQFGVYYIDESTNALVWLH